MYFPEVFENFGVKSNLTVCKVDGRDSNTETAICGQNSTAADADVNLLLILLPRVFLANRLNLAPADTGADIGCS